MKTIFIILGSVILTLSAFSQAPVFNNSFGTNGRVLTNLGMDQTAFSDASALQPDGKILMCGYMQLSSTTFCVIRVSPQGILDNTFGNNGRVYLTEAPFDAFSMAIQGDGKIIVTGSDDSSILVVRLNTNGTLDNTYNGNGKVRISTPGTNLRGYKIVLQSDGKAMLAGTSTNQAYLSDAFVARLLTNGTLDSSFNGNGKKVIPVCANNDVAYGIGFQSNGKIIITGFAYFTSNKDLYCLRLNTDGTNDNSFNGTGTYIYAGPYEDIGHSIAVQSDDKIIVGGSSNGDFLITRLTATGTLDYSFNSTGITNVSIGINNQVTNLFINSSGKIIVTGNSYISSATDWDFSAFQLTSTGILDPAFNGSGMMSIPVTNDVEHCTGSVLQPDGKLVLTGSSNQYVLFILARVNSNGIKDNTFGTNGIVIEQMNPTSDIAAAFITQPDNKIVVSGMKDGQLTNGLVLVRYLSNGKVDSSYGINGTHVYSIPNFSMRGMHYTTDNKIIISGNTGGQYPYPDAMTAVKVDANGNLDYTLNGNGIYTVPTNGIGNNTAASALQPDGKILLAGMTEDSVPSKIIVARVNSNGGMDASFGTNGITIIPVDTLYTYCSDMTLQNDGKILLTGSLDRGNNVSDLLVIRLNNDGSPDYTFNQTGTKLIELAPLSYNEGIRILVQPNGKIVIGGDLQTNSDFLAIIRLNSDGTFDNTFNDSGFVLYGSAPYGSYPTTLALGSQGRIYFGGFIYDSTYYSQMMLTRILPSGRVDSSFSPSGDGIMTINFNTPYSEMEGMGFKPDGSLILVGDASNPASLFSADFAVASLIPADGTLQLCQGGNTTLTSNLTGAAYQWQVNPGSGYVNISNNSIYSGTQSSTLTITGTPSSYYGYLYRCLVSGVPGNVYTLTFINHWTGAVSTAWENPANWNCGVVPDANTDVIINGASVVLNSTATIRSLTLQGGAAVTVTTGHVLTVLH